MRETDPLNPFTWPQFTRRLFVATLPVSLPLWLGFALLYLVVFAAIYAVLWPVGLAIDLWRGEA